MFANAARSLLGQQLQHLAPWARVTRLRSHMSQMRFKARAIYATFPATMHYYSLHRVSTLFDCKQKDSRPDDLDDEAVYVAENGLVYPPVRDPWSRDLNLEVSNGAIFIPNTRWIQEFTRMYSDQYYQDLVDEGKQAKVPYIYTVAKGTVVPSQLILIHEHKKNFSLQPSGQGILLNDRNCCLDEFYDKYAVKGTAHEWFEKHPLHTCADGAHEHIWMAQ